MKVRAVGWIRLFAPSLQKNIHSDEDLKAHVVANTI